MKEVFDQDIGKVKARSTLLNRYYNKSSESERNWLVLGSVKNVNKYL